MLWKRQIENGGEGWLTPLSDINDTPAQCQTANLSVGQEKERERGGEGGGGRKGESMSESAA